MHTSVENYKWLSRSTIRLFLSQNSHRNRSTERNGKVSLCDERKFIGTICLRFLSSAPDTIWERKQRWNPNDKISTNCDIIIVVIPLGVAWACHMYERCLFMERSHRLGPWISNKWLPLWLKILSKALQSAFFQLVEETSLVCLFGCRSLTNYRASSFPPIIS